MYDTKCPMCGQQNRSTDGVVYTCDCGYIITVKPECMKCKRLDSSVEETKTECYVAGCPAYKQKAILG